MACFISEISVSCIHGHIYGASFSVYGIQEFCGIHIVISAISSHSRSHSHPQHSFGDRILYLSLLLIVALLVHMDIDKSGSHIFTLCIDDLFVARLISCHLLYLSVFDHQVELRIHTVCRIDYNTVFY